MEKGVLRTLLTFAIKPFFISSMRIFALPRWWINLHDFWGNYTPQGYRGGRGGFRGFSGVLKNSVYR